MARDPSVADDFADELRSLIEHLAGALNVQVSRVDVDIPKTEIAVGAWPKLPKLELCEGSYAAVNGLPFAKTDGPHTIPIGFKPPQSRHHGSDLPPLNPGAKNDDAPKGTATIVPMFKQPANH
jgi:hypothetical protein